MKPKETKTQAEKRVNETLKAIREMGFTEIVSETPGKLWSPRGLHFYLQTNPRVGLEIIHSGAYDEFGIPSTDYPKQQISLYVYCTENIKQVTETPAYKTDETRFMIFNFINLNVLEEGHLEILNELKNEKETRVLYLEAKYDKLRKQYHLEDRFNIRFRMDPCMPNGELLRRLRPGERDNVITRMQRWEDANRKKFSDLPREEWVHVFAHINHLSYPEVEHILNNLPKGE